MNIRQLPVILFIFLLLSPSGTTFGADAPCRLIDTPTAGSLSAREFLYESQVFDGGGVVQRALFGLTDYVNIGVSYGGSNIVGSERVTWQPHIGFQFRVRLIEETMRGPALAFGFDSQGEGPFLPGEKLDRFRHKSRGIYLVLSRNYRFLGNLGFHGGINYSLETDDGDIDPSFWAGFDKNLGKHFDFRGEYDFAVNDGRKHSMVADRGYLNAMVIWRFGKGFGLEFDLRNILRSGRRESTGELTENPEPSRELRFSYSGIF
jgi:hypothetical protein